MVGRLLLFCWADWKGRGGEKIISGSGSNKRRSATKIKFWFWDILNRQANFGRGSRDFGAGWGKRAAPRKEKKYAQAYKKYCARNIMIPRVFFNLVSGSRHRGALEFPPF